MNFVNILACITILGSKTAQACSELYSSQFIVLGSALNWVKCIWFKLLIKCSNGRWNCISDHATLQRGLNLPIPNSIIGRLKIPKFQGSSFWQVRMNYFPFYIFFLSHQLQTFWNPLPHRIPPTPSLTVSGHIEELVYITCIQRIPGRETYFCVK